MSLQRKIFKDFNEDGHSTSTLHQTTEQEGAASAAPNYPRIIKSLGLLNVLLLTAAVVMGIYCAKDDYLQVPESAIAPLLAEMKFYRNDSSVTKARLEAEKSVAKERADGAHFRLELKKQMLLMDNILKRIETLQTKKRTLQTDTNALMESCNRCQPGWLFLKSSCYYFSSNNATNTKKNWFESRSNCVAQGGDLLVIDSVEEQLIISENFQKPRSTGTWWQIGSWMGLSENKTSGAWFWITNATVETFYWRLGQPKTEGPQTGSCAAFHHYGDARKTWYNCNCQEHQLNWICEAKPK